MVSDDDEETARTEAGQTATPEEASPPGEPPSGESPRDFIRRRMWELSEQSQESPEDHSED